MLMVVPWCEKGSCGLELSQSKGSMLAVAVASKLKEGDMEAQ